jgi:hypothetical protein
MSTSFNWTRSQPRGVSPRKVLSAPGSAPMLFKEHGRAARVALVATILAGGLMAVSSSAMAAAASKLRATVEAVPDTVSVSRDGLTTYAAYKVTVANTGGNTTNQVVYKASTAVLDANGTATSASALAAESTNGSCTIDAPTATSTAFTCAFGQMKSGDSRTFLLIFQAPPSAAGVNQKIELNSILSFCSNATCGNTNNVTIETAPVLTALITSDSATAAQKVKSAIPSGGGVFFTGDNGLTSTNNLHTTKVQVPDLSTLKIVSNNTVDETNVTSTVPFNCDSSNATNAKYVCYGFASQITVNKADTGAKLYLTGAPVLTITLIQDVSTIGLTKPAKKVGDVKLFYQFDLVDAQGFPIVVDGNPTVSQALVEIPSCSGSLPAINQPCVAGRSVVPKNSPGAGSFIFVIKARDNGRVSW